MSKFDLDRFNCEKIKLGEQPLKLKKTTYTKPKIKNGMLVDKEGNPIGTKGDMYAKLIMDRILQEGNLQDGPQARPAPVASRLPREIRPRRVLLPPGRRRRLRAGVTPPTTAWPLEDSHLICCKLL